MQPHRFPFVCSLRSPSGARHVCGATLIAPRLALTSAFCVTPPGGVPRPLLLCGLWRQYDQPPGTFDVLSAVRVTANQHYEAASFCSDIALLELNASAVHAAPLGGGTEQPGQWAPQAGDLLTAVGFGYTGPIE